MQKPQMLQILINSGLDENDILNALQDNGLVSDNCTQFNEVCEEDLLAVDTDFWKKFYEQN